jgi:hypothetical protein
MVKEMNATLAYEIGAVFLLAALLMAGSGAKSLLGLKTLRTVRSTMLVAGGILVAMALYRSLPDIMAMLPASDPHPAAAAPATATVVASPARTTHAVPKEPEKQYILYSAPVGSAASVAVVPAPVVVTPSRVPEPAAETAADQSTSKRKKVIKSVGHFLHIGK